MNYSMNHQGMTVGDFARKIFIHIQHNGLDQMRHYRDELGRFMQSMDYSEMLLHKQREMRQEYSNVRAWIKAEENKIEKSLSSNNKRF